MKGRRACKFQSRKLPPGTAKRVWVVLPSDLLQAVEIAADNAARGRSAEIERRLFASFADSSGTFVMPTRLPSPDLSL